MNSLYDEIRTHPIETMDAAYFLTMLARKAYDADDADLGQFLGFLSDVLSGVLDDEREAASRVAVQ